MIAPKDAADLLVDWLCRRFMGSKSRRIVWLLIAIATTGLMLMNDEAAGQQSAKKTVHGLTCNIGAIPPEQRARYTELFDSLRHAIQDKRELPDGYAVQLDSAQSGAKVAAALVSIVSRMFNLAIHG